MAQTFCLCLLLTGVLSATDQARPNIVLIIADDLGIGEPGCYGGDLPTPNIDALATAGVRFTSGYVTAPFCAASRAALLTGRYQTRFGFEFNPIGEFNADPGIGLPLSEITLPQLLRHGGYSTALIGKWHLGGTPPFHPQRHGFDEFFGFLHEGHYYVPPPYNGHVTWLRRRTLPDGGSGRWTSPDGRVIWSTRLNNFEPEYDTDNPLLRSSQPVTEKENLTDAFTREAIQFIERNSSQPFFLCLAYNAVHSPMQGRDDDLERFAHIEDVQRRLFAAMLRRLDQGVGRVTKRLKDLGLEDNTLVVFLSDNGGPTRELTSSNRPFRGEKGQLFEGGIRVPMIMKWPAAFPPARVEDRPVSTLDIFATAMTLGGMSAVLPIDGINLIPLLTGQAEWPADRGLYWRMGEQAAYRKGDWKALCRWHEQGGPIWELFNLKEDPEEKTNVARDHPDEVSSMTTEWRALNYKMVPARWAQGGRPWSLQETEANRLLFKMDGKSAP